MAGWYMLRLYSRRIVFTGIHIILFHSPLSGRTFGGVYLIGYLVCLCVYLKININPWRLVSGGGDGVA